MARSRQYEGCYATDLGLNVCWREDTGGVPRFENLFLRHGDLRRSDLDEVYRFLKGCEKAQQGPPWEQDSLPGIG